MKIHLAVQSIRDDDIREKSDICVVVKSRVTKILKIVEEKPSSSKEQDQVSRNNAFFYKSFVVSVSLLGQKDRPAIVYCFGLVEEAETDSTE